MRFLSSGLICVVLLYFIHGTPHAFAEKKSVAIFEYQPHNILEFTRDLVSKDEYYRAFVELQRLHSYYPKYISQGKFYVSELYLLHKGKRYPEILGKAPNGSNQNVKSIDKLFKGDVYLNRSEFIKASDIFGSSMNSEIDEEIDLFIYKRIFLSHLLLQRIDKAKRIIDNRKINIDGGDFSRFKESLEYSRDCYNSLKKPYRAICLGVVPGLGYAYSGRKQTGIIAFIVVSVLSTLTYYSFKTGNKPIGTVFGAASVFFYTGSILGGYMETKKYNNTVMANLKGFLFNKMDIEEDREKIFKEYGIGYVR